jgi:hypothetical protein
VTGLDSFGAKGPLDSKGIIYSDNGNFIGNILYTEGRLNIIEIMIVIISVLCQEVPVIITYFDRDFSQSVQKSAGM